MKRILLGLSLACMLATVPSAQQILLDKQQVLDAINALKPVTIPPAVKESCNADGTPNGVDEDQDGAVDEICKATPTPPACTFSLGSASSSVSPSTGTGSVQLTASPSGCSPAAWSANSDASWLTVIANGSGSTSVGFTYASNSATTQRVGTLTIAGQTHTVTQAAAPPPPNPGTGTVVWQTSYTTAEGWTANARQIGTGCGSGFAGKQSGVGDNGSWKTGNTCDEVIPEANDPAGRGGRGFRHWMGDGQNAGGGGQTITLPSAMMDLYFSVKIRYQSGMRWANGSPSYIKDIYTDPWPCGGGTCVILGYIDGGFGGSYDNALNMPSKLTWTLSQGGSVGDGQFHCYEWHVRKGTNGLFEFKFDGVPQLSRTANLGTRAIRQFMLGENQHNPSNGGPRYRDFDDLKVGTGGWLGCSAQ